MRTSRKDNLLIIIEKMVHYNNVYHDPLPRPFQRLWGSSQVPLSAGEVSLKAKIQRQKLKGERIKRLLSARCRKGGF